MNQNLTFRTQIFQKFLQNRRKIHNWNRSRSKWASWESIQKLRKKNDNKITIELVHTQKKSWNKNASQASFWSPLKWFKAQKLPTKWNTWRWSSIYSAGPSFLNLVDVKMRGGQIRHPKSLTLCVLCIYLKGEESTI